MYGRRRIRDEVLRYSSVLIHDRYRHAWHRGPARIRHNASYIAGVHICANTAPAHPTHIATMSVAFNHFRSPFMMLPPKKNIATTVLPLPIGSQKKFFWRQDKRFSNRGIEFSPLLSATLPTFVKFNFFFELLLHLLLRYVHFSAGIKMVNRLTIRSATVHQSKR